jgi:hypothetical protein
LLQQAARRVAIGVQQVVPELVRQRRADHASQGRLAGAGRQPPEARVLLTDRFRRAKPHMDVPDGMVLDEECRSQDCRAEAPVGRPAFAGERHHQRLRRVRPLDLDAVRTPQPIGDADDRIEIRLAESRLIVKMHANRLRRDERHERQKQRPHTYVACASLNPFAGRG